MQKLTSALSIGVLLLGVAAAGLGQNQPGMPAGAGPGGPNAPTYATSAEIEAAISRGKAYLYAQQRDGTWEISKTKQAAGGGGGPMGGRGENPETSSQWGGLTSIATFALLAAGESDRDDRVLKAMTFLKNSDITGTYALGLHAQLWPLIPAGRQKEIRANVQRDGNILLKGLKQIGDARGTYHYTPDDGGWDNSTAQYGVLGMWACVQAGYEVPQKYWQDVEDAWLRHQDRSGGWSYGGGMAGGPAAVIPGQGQQPQMGRPGGPPGGGPPGGRPGGPPGQPGMQPGGMPAGPGGPGMGGPPDSDKVTLSMTAAGVATLFITQDYLHGNSGVACKGNYNSAPIDAGLKWISDHYGDLDTDKHYYYTQFGISRIGLASGRKYFATKDWYKEGATQIVRAQLGDGSWKSSVSDTAFALLFLARGRAPVVMNKLEYTLAGKDGKAATANWNQRPRDAANATRYTARQLERDLNWQAVNLQVPVEELHDAPILYISGNQALSFTPSEEAKLREFVDQGGLILGNADCGNKTFADAFIALGHKLFSTYEFRDLPANHLIFMSGLAKLKMPPKVLGLSNGCRELMLLVPQTDPARSWQTMNSRAKENEFQLLSNIFLYASDKKNLRFKGENYVVKPDARVAATKSIQVARLKYAGNWNPEPGGWRQLAAVLNNRSATTLTETTVQLGEGKLAGYRVAHLTGTAMFKFSDAQRAEVKQFIEAGGTLIIDSAGGSTAFVEAAEAELVLMFVDAAKSVRTPVAADHAIYTAGGQKLAGVAYRAFARDTLVGALKSPRVGVVEVGGKVGVIYSPDDLSVGLVGHPVDGIIGYEPETATRLMTHFLLFAAEKK